MEIDLGSFLLRNWRMTDVSSLSRHANNIKIAKNLRDGFPNPYTKEDALKWLNKAINEENDILLAIDINSEAVGGIGISFFEDIYRKSAEIGYWLSEEYWNKGIMTAALKMIVKFCFKNYDIIRLQAGVFGNNKSSMKVLEKVGFKLESVRKKAVYKNDRILDEYLYVIFND